jgi:hypothetical protein
MSRRPATRRVPLALAGLLALLPAGAQASSVYLNGVKIDGVTNQQFERAKVRIDAQGNVHIDAPGYAVRTVTPPPEAAPAAPAAAAPGPKTAAAPASPEPAAAPTQRYWLVGEPGTGELEVDVFLNGRWLRRLRSAEGQVLAELTPHLKLGRNTVLLTARRASGAAATSPSPAQPFRVIIGEGRAEGSQVTIDAPLVRFQRLAAESNDGSRDVSEEFSFTTR